MNNQKIYQISLGIILLILMSTVLPINASDGNKLLIDAISISDEAYIKIDKSLYLKSHGICERVYSAEPNNFAAQYYLGYNKYRLINIAMLNKDYNQFDLYYDSAIKILEPLLENEDYKSETKTLLAAVYMMKLAIDQSDAPNLSIKINSYLGQAIKIDSTNPRSYLVKGTMLFNTPTIFGGSIKGAIENFSKAITFFESNSENTNLVKWGYLEVLAWKGKALSKQEKYTSAKIVYEKALKIEPKFGWVKYRLLPELEKSDKIKETSTNDKLSTLTVLVTGFESNDGFILMKLNNSQEEFESKTTFFRKANKEIIDGKVEYSFMDLPFGEYAFSCYHDENNNGKLDSNFLGIPKETYGFSNNAKGSFGPPSYSDVKFNIDKKNISIEVNLN